MLTFEYPLLPSIHYCRSLKYNKNPLFFVDNGLKTLVSTIFLMTLEVGKKETYVKTDHQKGKPIKTVKSENYWLFDFTSPSDIL